MPELMWVLLALAVLVGVGGGWLLSRGRLGEMPAVVDDRPQPRIPEGPFSAVDVAAVRFARAGQGYDRAAVEQVLQVVRRGLEDPATREGDDLVQLCGSSRFRVVRGGYQMGQVDAVLDRLAHQFRVDEPLTDEPVEPSADASERPEAAQRPAVRNNGVEQTPGEVRMYTDGSDEAPDW